MRSRADEMFGVLKRLVTSGLMSPDIFSSECYFVTAEPCSFKVKNLLKKIMKMTLRQK